jgi:hypothetical protein
MEKVIQMKLSVKIGHVIITIQDVMVFGVVLMEQTKKTVQNHSSVLRALFLVFHHTTTLSHVCQQIKLVMDISIVLEQQMNGSIVDGLYRRRHAMKDFVVGMMIHVWQYSTCVMHTSIVHSRTTNHFVKVITKFVTTHTTPISLLWRKPFAVLGFSKRSCSHWKLRQYILDWRIGQLNISCNGQ